MSDIESRLDLMEAFLERAVAWTAAQTILPAILRQNILQITKACLKTGYSPELHDADVALTIAIQGFQFGRTDQRLDLIRERLNDYRAAAMSSHYCHPPIQGLIEVAARRRSWAELGEHREPRGDVGCSR